MFGIDIPTIEDIVNFVKIQMTTNQWFQTVGFFGVLAAVWQYARAWPSYIWTRIRRKIVFTAHIEQYSEFFKYMERYIDDHYKKSYRNVEVLIKRQPAQEVFIIGSDNNEKNKKSLVYKHFQDLFFIPIGLTILKISKDRDKLENAHHIDTTFINSYTITGLFAQKSIDALLKKIYDYNIDLEEQEENRTRIHIHNKDYWEPINNIVPKNLNNIILKGKQELLDDLDAFHSNKKWYTDRAIKYSRGYLFDGEPGNGKTSLALAIAKHYNKDIFILNLNQVNNSELISLFSEINRDSLLLIEDIDVFFQHDNTRKLSKGELDFSTLLNCLDGVFSADDIVTIFTTNHKEALDSALTRSGRIDYHKTINNPKCKEVSEYLSIFYDTDIKVKVDNKKYCMSDIQNFCLSFKENPDAVISIINKQ